MRIILHEEDVSLSEQTFFESISVIAEIVSDRGRACNNFLSCRTEENIFFIFHFKLLIHSCFFITDFFVSPIKIDENLKLGTNEKGWEKIIFDEDGN